MDAYVVQADGMFPRDYSGNMMGKLFFENGTAKTDKYIWVKLAMLKGCHDITPPDVKQRLLSRPYKRILVIRNAAWGDGLIITPAIRALREKYPNAIIHLFGRTDSKAVYEGLPFIDGMVSLRETELGVVFDSYDEVFDMVHSIECRPEADYENALDVACKMMGTGLPSDPKPVYVVGQEELRQAKEMLKELEANTTLPIIVMQVEATAKVRTLPPTTTLMVANHFAKKGYCVIMAGHDMPIANTYLSECPVCHAKAAFAAPERQAITQTCSACGNVVAFSPLPNHPNIVFLHKVFTKYPARVHFAVASMAKLIISIDSVWSHLAAALNIPSVIIFSNYHPYTRTKYYDRCVVVHPDYENEVPCGPCNSLTGFCHMHDKKLAPCTTTIKPEAIIQAAEERLTGVVPAFQLMRDTSPLVDHSVRYCPACGSTHHTELTCKGSYLYVRCYDCGTIYTAVYPDTRFWQGLKKLVAHKQYYRPSRANKAADIIGGIAKVLVETKVTELDPKENICDLINDIEDYHVGRINLASQDPRIVQRSENDSSLIQERVALWIEGLQEKEKPIEALKAICDRLLPGAVLLTMCPLADKYSGVNSWPALNAVVAGLNTLIPSTKAIKEMFKLAGFSTCHVANNSINALVVAQK